MPLADPAVVPTLTDGRVTLRPVTPADVPAIVEQSQDAESVRWTSVPPDYTESDARAYLQHPVLGKRLADISEQLLKLEENNATHIFGSPDDLKLRSSMTLFAAVPGAAPVFQQVLDKFYRGEKDTKTLNLL